MEKFDLLFDPSSCYVFSGLVVDSQGVGLSYISVTPLFSQPISCIRYLQTEATINSLIKDEGRLTRVYQHVIQPALLSHSFLIFLSYPTDPHIHTYCTILKVDTTPTKRIDKTITQVYQRVLLLLCISHPIIKSLKSSRGVEWQRYREYTIAFSHPQLKC
jgi:hypothetical protein